jgi:hypothetical protein
MSYWAKPSRDPKSMLTTNQQRRITEVLILKEEKENGTFQIRISNIPKLNVKFRP